MKTTYLILTAILSATLSFACNKTEPVQKEASKLEETISKTEKSSELEKALANEEEAVTKCEKRRGKVFISYGSKDCAQGYGAREIVTCLTGSNLSVNSFGFPCDNIPENSEERWIANCQEVSGEVVQKYEAEKHLYKDSSKDNQSCFWVRECVPEDPKLSWGPLADLFKQIPCDFSSTASLKVKEIKHFSNPCYCSIGGGPI